MSDANVWEPRSIVAISGDTKSVEERLVAASGQSVFVVTTFAYVTGTGALEVHKNGLLLAKGVDWNEVSGTSFVLTIPAALNDVIIATGKVGIEGTVPVEPVVPDPLEELDTHALLQAYTGDATTVYVKGNVSVADGGEGIFVKRDTGTPGFFTAALDTVIPTAGDGSVAWVGSPTRKILLPVTSYANLRAIPSHKRIHNATVELHTNGNYTRWLLINSAGHGITVNTVLYQVLDANWYAQNISDPQFTSKHVTQYSMNDWRRKMEAGESVAIACWGDSTVEGYGLAGYVANPVNGSGVPNGTVEYQPALAWPAKLRTRLRAAFNNNNIRVYNLGYAGRSLADGWGYTNYEAAVANPANVVYPDITLICFGINDVGLTVGDDGANFGYRLEDLVLKLLTYGTTPVMVTCSPILLNGVGTILDNKEIHRSVDTIKRYIADKYGLEVIDVTTDVQDFLEYHSNTSVTPQITFGEYLADGIHISAEGHSLIAASVFKHFYRDMVYYNGGDRNISSFPSYSNATGEPYTMFRPSNTRQGGNFQWGSSAPGGTVACKVHIWNTCPNAWILYMGISNEGVGSAAGTRPFITLSSPAIGTNVTKFVAAATLADSSHGHADSDLPYIVGKLMPGLNEISYTLGTNGVAYHGNFRIIDGRKELPTDALYGSGRMERTYTLSTGEYFEPLPEARDLANIVSAGLIDGDTSIAETAIIRFDVNLPVYSGLIALYGNAFTSLEIDVDFRLKSGVILHRDNSNRLVLSVARWREAGSGTPNLTQVGISAALTWGGGHEFVGRIEITSATGPNRQRVRVYEQYVGGTAVIDVYLTGDRVRYAGNVGGIYFDSDTAAATRTVTINELLIERTRNVAVF